MTLVTAPFRRFRGPPAVRPDAVTCFLATGARFPEAGFLTLAALLLPEFALDLGLLVVASVFSLFDIYVTEKTSMAYAVPMPTVPKIKQHVCER